MIHHHTPAVGTPGLGRLLGRLLQDASAAPAGPPLTVYEDGDQLVVEAQLPGMKLEDIDASVEQGVLTIRSGMGPSARRRDAGPGAGGPGRAPLRKFRALARI